MFKGRGSKISKLGLHTLWTPPFREFAACDLSRRQWERYWFSKCDVERCLRYFHFYFWQRDIILFPVPIFFCFSSADRLLKPRQSERGQYWMIVLSLVWVRDGLAHLGLDGGKLLVSLQTIDELQKPKGKVLSNTMGYGQHCGHKLRRPCSGGSWQKFQDKRSSQLLTIFTCGQPLGSSRRYRACSFHQNPIFSWMTLILIILPISAKRPVSAEQSHCPAWAP